MKLYKFRSIANSEELKRVARIVETGEFWCSKFWEMNDPMEGVFLYDSAYKQHLTNIFSEKKRFSICSFSSSFENPALWGYYANSFKGVAIEIETEVDSEKDNEIERMRGFHEVDYLRESTTFNGGDVLTVLTTKLDDWRHEKEYRYIVEGDKDLYPIGEITKILFGRPYGHTDNNYEVYSRSPDICEYEGRANYLRAVAHRNGKSCRDVRVENGKVTEV